jgi:hypothetical protein
VWTHQTGQPPTSFNIIIFITIISRVAANPNFDLLRSQTSRASPPNSRPAEFHLPRLSRSLGIFVFFPVQVLVPLATNSPAIAASSVSIPFLVVLCRPVLFFAYQFFFFFSRLSGWLPSQKSDQRQTSADDSDVLVAHKHSRLSPLIRSSSFRVR